MSTTTTEPATEHDLDVEPEDDETPDTPVGEQVPAFDASDYEREDLQITKVDGHGIDKIRVRFSGSVMLDRSNPADVALFNRLTLGHEPELRVAGKISHVGTGWATNREGDLDAIVGERAVRIETVWILDPEEL